MINTNRLYLTTINIVVKVEHKGDFKNTYADFLKNSFVYHNEYNDYIDITSGEKYNKGIEDTWNAGDMYIDFKKGLIPISEISELNFERKNMSKRKILKKLSNTSLYNKKEEDK